MTLLEFFNQALEYITATVVPVGGIVVKWGHSRLKEFQEQQNSNLALQAQLVDCIGTMSEKLDVVVDNINAKEKREAFENRVNEMMDKKLKDNEG
mgnify:CR=1 FL=1